LNRGIHPDPFADQVQRIKCDRKNPVTLAAAIGQKDWDVVFDQMCYDAKEARAACEIFRNQTPLYVVTSSCSVYGDGAKVDERAFNPRAYELLKDVDSAVDYAEAKRQMETVFAHEAAFRVIMPRFSIVCGSDDYTKRLDFHIKRIQQGEPIYFPNLDARMSFIESDEAGACLKFLAETNVKGPINCASSDAISMRDLISWIETAVGKKAVLAEKEEADNHSPYGVSADHFPSTARLEALGFKTRKLKDWLPDLIEECL
jgi:nucleoside-diphosphate-sugar epimerase